MPEQGGQPTQRGLEVGAPDVAAVDDAGDQASCRASSGTAATAGSPPATRSMPMASIGVRGQRGQCGVERAEVGGDEDRRALGVRSPARRRRARRARGRVVQDVGHQHRLVELNPLRAGLGEQTQQLGVERNQLVEPRDRRGRALGGLAQRQERDRADDHRPSGNALLLSLLQLGEHFARIQRERGVRADLRDEVVVVRVEPLRHLQRRDVLGAARRREVAVEIVGDAGDAGRQCAHQDSGVEHLVVEGEGVDRDRVQPGNRQGGPGFAA